MWKGAGTGTITGSGNDLTILKLQGQGDNKDNAMFVEGGGFTEGEKYWEINIGELERHGSVFVGLTTEERLQPGYRVSGYFYGGNLSDGSGLLVGSFGPQIKGGDRVGLCAKADGSGGLKLYVFFNGTPLGVAFDLKAFVKPLHPIVSVSGDAKLSIRTDLPVPNPLEVPESFDYSSLLGTWTCDELTHEVITPDVTSAYEGVKLTVHTGENTKDGFSENYHFAFKVANCMNFSVWRNPNGDAASQSGISTMMFPHGKLGVIESAMKSIKDVKTVQLVEEGRKLEVKGANFKFLFKRSTSRKPPVREVEFRH